jgi:hypothetical protein
MSCRSSYARYDYATRLEGTMKTVSRGPLVLLAVLALTLSAAAAKGDSISITYSGTGINGWMSLNGAPLGGGVYQVTSLSGVENGISILGLVGGSGPAYFWLPDGSGYLYDNLVTPASYPIFGYPGLLYQLMGSAYPQNIYWSGNTYLEASYLGGGNFPQDFQITPISIHVSSVPEPGTLALFGVSLIALGSLLRQTKRKASASN